MSYDWHQYWVYAKNLLTHGSNPADAEAIDEETIRRVAVGRAYYAFYNLILEALPNHNLKSMREYYRNTQQGKGPRFGNHRLLKWFLENGPNVTPDNFDDYHNFSRELGKLYQQRVHADYKSHYFTNADRLIALQSALLIEKQLPGLFTSQPDKN